MLFDRDKQPEIPDLKGFPLIISKNKQLDHQSNKSLYKNDSDSSHLTVYPQNDNILHQKSYKQTLNPKISYASNDPQNNNSIKKYLKKGDQFNKLTAKKIFRIQQASSKNLNYQLPKQFSINRLQNQIASQQKSNDKRLKKIYISQNKQKKTKSPLQNLVSKTPKRFSTLSKLSQPKQTRKLVHQEVQTQKLIEKVIKPKKTKGIQNIKNTLSAKINSLDIIQKDQIEKNYEESKINEKKQEQKSKFINLSSILQKDQEQAQIPKKINTIRHNNLQTKHIINKSFTGQQSTAPSLYANSYLDSMSKLSYNFSHDVQKIKNYRYDQPEKIERYSKTLQIIEKPDQKQEDEEGIIRGPQTNIRKLTQKSKVSNQNSKLNQVSQNKNKSKQKQISSKINEMITKSNNNNSRLNPQQFAFDEEKISISLSIVPQQSETGKSFQAQSFNKADEFSSLSIVDQEKDQFQRGSFNNLNSNENSGQKYKNERKGLKQNNYKQKLKNKKVDQMMQFPEVTQLKVSDPLTRHELKGNKLIHPIRNDFNQKGVSWIVESYRPKSKLFEMINMNSFNIKKYRNGVYFGQLNQNKKEGHGIIFYYNGKLYEGQFSDDMKQGNGYEEFPDSSKYLGQFNQGSKHGKGIFQWSNGQVYEGEWEYGKKSGSGIWKSSEGQSYIGQWKNGLVQGFGVYISKNGDRYEGQFKNSQKQGYGTERYRNGQTYVGEYRKNRPNGQGQYFWTNGNYYKGEFVNHLRHGEGYFKDPKHEQIYQGQYRNDKKCGYGQLVVGQSTYVGNFQNDYKHGYGQLYEKGQCTFKGYWINGHHLEDQQNNEEDYVCQQHKIHVISQKPQLTNIRSNARFNNRLVINLQKSRNRLVTNLQRSQKKEGLSKSLSPPNKSVQSAQNSLQKSNYKRACGCTRRH